MLLLALPPTLSEPSSSYHWRFRIQETYMKDNKVVTCLTNAGDCHPRGCSRLLALQLQHSFSSTHGTRTINLGYFCFTFHQTEPYCQERAKWVEEYGGCPYWSCRIHYIKFNTGSHSVNSLEASYGGSQVCLYIPDPWDNRWATGVTAKGYQPGYYTHPTNLKIWRLYEQVVP
jgi:hypothetical protein